MGAYNLSSKPLVYDGGYKYRLRYSNDHALFVPDMPELANLELQVGAAVYSDLLGHRIILRDPVHPERVWATLEMDGTLTIFADALWDGPSGPAIDTDNFMLPSIAHDMGYSMLETKQLPMKYRKAFDLMMLDLCEETGMSWTRRHLDYLGVRIGGRIRMWWRSWRRSGKR